jgi:cell division protein FtsZ
MEQKQIVIVGAGGCGVNSIHRLAKVGLKNCELIAVNSDDASLRTLKGADAVLLANTEADPRIAGKLSKQSIVFVLAGVGGKFGAASALILARKAKERGAGVISILTRPFALERRRYGMADGAIASMRKVADEVIIRDNDSVIKHMPDKTITEALDFMDMDLCGRISAFADSKSTEAGGFFTGWMYEE